jgi:hypothetical protein
MVSGARCGHEVSASQIVLRAVAGHCSPWNVTDVVFDGGHKVVTVFVESASGAARADAETGKRAKIKVWHGETWRHLDTIQF